MGLESRSRRSSEVRARVVEDGREWSVKGRWPPKGGVSDTRTPRETTPARGGSSTTQNEETR